MEQEKHYKIELPETFTSETRVVAIDTHTNIAQYTSNSISDIFMVSTQAINEESNNTLSKRGVSIYQNFFSSSSVNWPVPIMIDLSKGEKSHTEFTIQMTKSDSSQDGFSSWTLTSSNGYIMNLKEEVLKPNSIRKRGDLNFATLLFVFLVAGISIKNGSEEVAIEKSIKTFRIKTS